MTSPTAILIAGALIAAAIGLQAAVDRYEVSGTFTLDGQPAAFRLSQRSGLMEACVLAPDPHPRSPDPVERFFVHCTESPPQKR